MENSKATQILEALANGIDPISGEVLPSEHFLQHPDIIRSLFLASQVMKGKITKIKGHRLNEGARWTNEEDEQVKNEFQNNIPVAEIAKAHQRSYGAIRSRLIRHGLIDKDAYGEQSS
jgi:hypothetical protein